MASAAPQIRALRQTVVRLATEADHEAIHRLNYRTFVEEIPQHAPNPDGRLVDRFHEENVYAVYEVDGHVVGMVAGRTTRPFSLDQKLGDVDRWLPAGSHPVEVRLLAVERPWRATRVFTRLVGFITRHLMAQGFDLAVISGTTRQLALYRHLGFTPFAECVGSADALYQPMYITAREVRDWPTAMRDHDEPSQPEPHDAGGGCFLTGPVAVREEVARAFSGAPQSHRAEVFTHRLRELRARLCALTGAPHATVLLGSGTLANDIVAGQLLQLDGPGVIAVNGEFGERLVDHAQRMGLTFEAVRTTWGAPLDVDTIEATLSTMGARWLWAVHQETSTGVLNDLAALQSLARQRSVRLALDAVSSVGGVPVDLSGVWLASAVSGKALASYPGLAIVFHDDLPQTTQRPLPRYLDLALATTHDSVPFTHSSNLVDALAASLEANDWPQRFARRQRDGQALRSALTQAGFDLVTLAAHASPIVHTVALPDTVSAERMGSWLRARGWHVGFESGYLRGRNWLQLCLMGEYDTASLRALPGLLVSARDASRTDVPYVPVRVRSVP